MIQDKTISLIIRRLSAEIPLASPTPKTAPTIQWVVEIGIPSLEAIKIVSAAPNSAENPLSYFHRLCLFLNSNRF